MAAYARGGALVAGARVDDASGGGRLVTVHEHEWTGDYCEGCPLNSHLQQPSTRVFQWKASISRGFPDLSVLCARAGRMRPVSRPPVRWRRSGDPSSIAGQGYSSRLQARGNEISGLALALRVMWQAGNRGIGTIEWIPFTYPWCFEQRAMSYGHITRGVRNAFVQGLRYPQTLSRSLLKQAPTCLHDIHASRARRMQAL